MKVLFVGDSHTWMLSEDPSTIEHMDSVKNKTTSPVPAGTIGFRQTKLYGNQLDFLWKTGMNAHDAKAKRLTNLFILNDICPCSYDYVVFSFGDMDIQFKGSVRPMKEAAEEYFNGVLGAMAEYPDKIVLKDPTCRLGVASDLFHEFTTTVETLAKEKNIPFIKTMTDLFDGSYESADYIGHMYPEQSEHIRLFVLGYLAAINN